MSRYDPPIGTAGFDRVFVNGYKREPAPPPKTMAATVFAFAIADTDCCLSVGCARASERVSFWILVLLLLLIREFGEERYKNIKGRPRDERERESVRSVRKRATTRERERERERERKREREKEREKKSK